MCVPDGFITDSGGRNWRGVCERSYMYLCAAVRKN